LTGFGERHHLDHGQVTFDTFVTDIGAVLEFEDLHDVVLVGHSMGGVVVPRVAEAFPARIRKVVGWPPWCSRTVRRSPRPFPPESGVQRSFVLQPDGTIRTDPALMIAALVSDGTPEERAWVLARHRSYPRRLFWNREDCRATWSWDPEWLRGRQQGCGVLPPSWRTPLPAGCPARPFAEVEAGHDLMITRPVETAAALLAVS